MVHFSFWKSECWFGFVWFFGVVLVLVFFFTKTIGLKDRIKLRSLWNSKSCSAPELNYFDLERVVLLVTTEVLKIQTDTVY